MKASLAKSDPRSLIGYSAIYIILGAFSFSTAYVQANTATVWLPSGFAVGLLISRGARCWPAVSLGSLLLNVGVGFFSSVQVSVTTLIGSATFIAFGNTLEALLGLRAGAAPRRWRSTTFKSAQHCRFRPYRRHVAPGAQHVVRHPRFTIRRLFSYRQRS